MKTLLTCTILTLLALTTLDIFAQSRKLNTPLTKIELGSYIDYEQSDYLANKVRRLERVVNQMQDHIISLEYAIQRIESVSLNNQTVFFCELISDKAFGIGNGSKVYTSEANSQRKASASVFKECIDDHKYDSYRCKRNNVRCERIYDYR